MRHGSGQNLTPTRFTRRVQRQKHGEALRIPIPEAQPLLNLMAALTHSSEATLPSEDISRPESEVIQPPRADSTRDRISCHVATLSTTMNR